MHTLLLLLLLGCSPGDDSGLPAETPTDWAAPGPHGVGTSTLRLDRDGRAVPVRAWYPAPAGTTTSRPLEHLVEDDDNRDVLAQLLQDAPAGCPARESVAVEDAPAADLDGVPLVAFSHCHTCLGLSGASIAAHLASHGFAVVAPDHTGNTLFDALDGDGGSLDEATLALRAADLEAALDAALEGTLLPGGLVADPDRVGVMGHSFGSVTAGRVLAEDPRPKASLHLAAPPDNPLLQGLDAAATTAPVTLVLLEEDNSIGTPGNTLIESNFAEFAGPARLVRVPDAGHWSVSDLCGVIEDFQPGCGEGERQSGGAPFTYIDATAGRATAAAIAAAVFAEALNGDAGATAWLAAPDTPVAVSVETR